MSPDNDDKYDSSLETDDTTLRLAEADDPVAGDRVHGVLTVLAGRYHGAMFMLEQEETIIGRGRGNQIYIADEGISRIHARIVHGPDAYYIRDAGSKNGTFVQGQRIDGAQRLADGDRIALGSDTVLKFTLQDQLEKDAARRTIELTTRDPLTQLLNRRHLDERLRGEFAYAARHGTTLYVLMIDLDKFKDVNDTHGHQAGDKVLRAVSTALEKSLRVEDTVGRYGGEEFLIFVRGIDDKGIHALAERVRANIENLRVAFEDNNLEVTVSVGVVEMTSDHADSEAVVAQADEAMYRAKKAGRNRVEFY